MSKKVAEQLVEMLVEAGVKRIYAVAGDSLNELNDAVRKNEHITWIHVRHEEAGAYAAAAEAELNGLACCAGSSGPGHVHLINGLYDAHRAGSPVLAIASTCATHEFGSGYFQETNVINFLMIAVIITRWPVRRHRFHVWPRQQSSTRYKRKVLQCSAFPVM